MVKLDYDLLPSGNAKGFFGYFLLGEPTFGSALGKSNSQSERSAAKYYYEDYVSNLQKFRKVD